jgi:hypothetical protein
MIHSRTSNFQRHEAEIATNCSTCFHLNKLHRVNEQLNVINGGEKWETSAFPFFCLLRILLILKLKKLGLIEKHLSQILVSKIDYCSLIKEQMSETELRWTLEWTGDYWAPCNPFNLSVSYRQRMCHACVQNSGITAFYSFYMHSYYMQPDTR